MRKYYYFINPWHTHYYFIHWLFFGIFYINFAFQSESVPSLANICCDDSGHLIAVRGPDCSPGFSPYRAAGINIFDAFWDASSGQGRGQFGLNATVKALVDAKSAGILYFRFFASLWGPHKQFWYNTSTRKLYWQEFDQVMDEIQKLKLYVIPSIGTSDWPDLVSPPETMNDLVINDSSISRSIARQYFRQIVKRYVNYSSVLLWELGNELNLMANLPPTWCSNTTQCFNTNQMISYTQDLVSIIRELDPIRPISSGYSAPRPTAWHQEHCPPPQINSINNDCKYWGTDTQEQWAAMLLQQNKAVEIVSIHLYTHGGFFSKDAPASLEPIQVAADALKKTGQLLFVGEYANSSLRFNTSTDRAFPAAMLQLQVEQVQRKEPFALSAIWAWECPSHMSNMGCLWPNRTNGTYEMIEILTIANDQMNNSTKYEKS